MKKIINIFLIFIFCLNFSACSKNDVIVENTQVSSNYPLYKQGEIFNYKDMVDIQISQITPIKESNKILISFIVKNISNQDIDVSRFKGFFDIYVGDSTKYDTNEGFKLISQEKRRDYINNDKQEELGILRANAKIMFLYEWSFAKDSETFYEDYGEVLSNIKNMTIFMEPWYFKTDTSDIKEDYFIFEIDFKDIFNALNTEELK